MFKKIVALGLTALFAVASAPTMADNWSNPWDYFTMTGEPSTEGGCGTAYYTEYNTTGDRTFDIGELQDGQSVQVYADYYQYDPYYHTYQLVHSNNEWLTFYCRSGVLSLN
jgi:hypothetical protein